MNLVASSFLKKILFQSCHRGTKENDLILGAFARACLLDLSSDEQHIFSDFLEEKDSDLFQWITGKMPAPPPYKQLVSKIQNFHCAPNS